jgi:hypothetical protein
MRSDYRPFFRQLINRLTDLGFIGVSIETDLYAQINLNSGWTVEFEGERNYGPSFTISISTPLTGSCVPRQYAVWLLMKVFETKLDRKFSSFSIDDQVDFLVANRLEVFENERGYLDLYITANTSSS